MFCLTRQTRVSQRKYSRSTSSGPVLSDTVSDAPRGALARGKRRNRGRGGRRCQPSKMRRVWGYQNDPTEHLYVGQREEKRSGRQDRGLEIQTPRRHRRRIRSASRLTRSLSGLPDRLAPLRDPGNTRVMAALAVKPKLASRQKTSVEAIRVIAVASLAADLHQEKVAANDEHVSAQSLYAYVSNNPLRWIDPTGLYEVAPGIQRPTGPLNNLLTCTESCLGVSFTVTSSYRPGPNQGAHGTGEAADARYRGPGTGNFSAEKFLCCAARCGAGYGQDEFNNPSPGSTGPHLHIQIPGGTRGGRGDLPMPGCDPDKCGQGKK